MMETYIVLFIVLGIVAAASFFFRNDETKLAPIIFAAAAAGALAAGMGLRIRELVEGPFGYLDCVLTVLSGMLFVIMLMDNGTFALLLEKISTKKRIPFVQALMLLLLVALPGMFSGTAAACVLTAGTIVGPYLIRKGVEKVKAMEFVAVGSLLGMLLPPVSLPAMIIVVSRSGSFPAPFAGYSIPLLVAALPALLLYAGKTARWIGTIETEQKTQNTRSVKCLIPLAVVVILLLSHDFLYTFTPFLGYPLIFIIGTILAVLLPAKKINILKSAGRAINLIAPVVAVAFAVASALEIFTLTGAAGKLGTICFSVNPAIVAVASVVIIVICGLFLGGPFAAIVGVLCSYVIGVVAYGSSEMLLTAISAALCVAIFLPVRGGLIARTAAVIGEEGTDAKKIIAGAFLPVILILAIGIIYALAYNNLAFLVV